MGSKFLRHQFQTGSGASGYWGLFPWGLNGWGVELATYLHLVPKLKMSGAVLPVPHTS